MEGPSSLVEHFSSVTDPRIERTKKHKLIDVIVLAICAIVCGADDWDDVVMICKEKIDWFKKFLTLENGIPCADTFQRVFSRIAPLEFENSFSSWTKAAADLTHGEIVAIDGKTLRRSHAKSADKNAIHMISAWANDAQMVLGQLKVDDKTNEITAIPQLLDMLDVAGCIVTTDAMGCQQEIAQKIIAKEADYVFGLKGNQGKTCDAVKMHFDTNAMKDVSTLTTTDGDHGRIDTRKYSLARADKVTDLPFWPGIQSIAMVESHSEFPDGKTRSERRYYISSLECDVKKIAKAIRAHWGIENSLHWVLDVQMDEDGSRIRKGNAAENFARMRRLTINMLKAEKTRKLSIRKKRMMSMMSNDYLMKVLRAGD